MVKVQSFYTLKVPQMMVRIITILVIVRIGKISVEFGSIKNEPAHTSFFFFFYCRPLKLEDKVVEFGLL